MKTKLLYTFLLTLLTAGIQAQSFWSEDSDGDLSDDAAAPSGVFTLVAGNNTVTANQTGDPRDVDFFAFTVPAGMILEQLVVDAYNGADAQGFIGIDAGATSDIDFNNPSSGDLLGGTTYGTASIGTDILPAMGNLGGATGFTAPLAEGAYTIWLNQTGGLSEATLNFVVAESTVIWDEAIDGDLSDDGTNPTGAFTLTPDADNIVIANQVGNPRDVDFFTFTVPTDFQLDQLIVVDYVSGDDVAFIAIDEGATTDVDFNNPAAADLLGGTTYGTASIGNDILPAMGNLGGATGFTPPLPAGDYTIWLNQTGAISEVMLNFVLGEALSLDDNSLGNEIAIFPNPVQNNLQISSTENINSIAIFDILGKQINVSSNTSTMDVSSLASGVYLAQITTPTGTVTRKIIKE